MYLSNGIPDIKHCLDAFIAQISKETGVSISAEDDYFQVWSFPQTWGSMALGFDAPSEHSGTLVGCNVITEAPSVVIFNRKINMAGVFFLDMLAYLVTEPSDVFWEDLKNHNMQPMSVAKKRYQ